MNDILFYYSSFLVTGKYLNALFGNDNQNSNESIVEMNFNERIQINCGIYNTEEDDTKDIMLFSRCINLVWQIVFQIYIFPFSFFFYLHFMKF
jgi:hypothetical protein